MLLSILGVAALLAALVISLRGRSKKPEPQPEEITAPPTGWGAGSALPAESFTFRP